MKVLLLRDARIKHYAGEIIDVSPDEFNFLVSVKSAIPMGEVMETPEDKKTTRSKKK